MLLQKIKLLQQVCTDAIIAGTANCCEIEAKANNLLKIT